MAKDVETELRKIAMYIICKLSEDDCQDLWYIYNIPECHRATKLDMFEYLQNKIEMFSAANPEGLIKIVSDIERQDLVKLVTAKVYEYKNKSTIQAEPSYRTYHLNQHQELKYHFEATIKLYPLHALHIKILSSVLAHAAQDDPDKPNTNEIRQLLIEADECFKNGTDKMLKAAQAIGFKDSMSQLIPCQPQEVSMHEESKGKGRFKKLFQRQKQKSKTSVPYKRARSYSFHLTTKDSYEHLDISDDEQAVHNTGGRTPMNIPTREHQQAPQERETTTEEDSDSKKLQPNQDPKSFRTIFEVNFDAKGLKYHMSDHGITVIIPENAVTTEALLSIGVYYVNTFQLPKGHRLVSEVFWIKTSVPLQKNVELYVPHFAKVRDDNDSTKLGFFIASDISTEKVQTLTKVPENTSSFEPESYYGKLVMEHFCSGCILERIDGNGLPVRYLITRVFPKDFRKLENWRAEFVFSYALKPCLMVIEKQYSGNYSFARSTFTFTQPSVMLDYNIEPVTGWFITQVDMLREISRDQIDYRSLLRPGDTAKEQVALLQHYEEISEYPPRLVLEIVRTELARNHLKTDVMVKGVDKHLKTLIFALCPGVPEAPPVSEVPPSEEHATHHTSLAEKKRNQFLSDAILALQDCLINDWYTLGLHLGLYVTDLNVIESNSLSSVDKRTCVRQMLTRWTDKLDREATWEKIVSALRKIGNKQLAREIEEQFIQSEKL